MIQPLTGLIDHYWYLADETVDGDCRLSIITTTKVPQGRHFIHRMLQLTDGWMDGWMEGWMDDGWME
ncbi:MAG: hypothetical protein LBK96_03040 [Prevotellaceae bacterium]|nr:hypothetical protein [Prevotellaceae bacterium]